MTIRVALEENVEWGYYQFILDGQHRGLEIDLLKHIDTQSPYTIQFTEKPWKRAMKSALNGNIDILISATSSPKRDHYYDYTDKIYEINQVLYYDTRRYPDGFSFMNQDQLGAYKIGSILGYNIDAIRFPISHSGFRSLSDMAQAIEKGHIDFGVGYLELENYNKHMPKPFSHVAIPNHPPLHCHWLIAKDNPRKADILSELNLGLKKLKTSGQYATLEAVYTGHTSPHDRD
ncbi:substrate-binding periplasmic protein [Rubritalea tangerina]|uniref:Substrate-binding periplasmic protein n=2 Tax=Rubritalea tangerina TaxID=430798 RepID=A0ABW4ZAH0_9BACT